MGQDSKHAFWQAFIVTVAVFIIGIFVGIVYENNRTSKITDRFILSEQHLIDTFALSNLATNNKTSCETLMRSNIEFANRIYEDAKLMEKYEDSEKITKNIVKGIHKKYDLLRTLLWINLRNNPEQCKTNYSVIIYLYKYEPESIVKKATNNVWSRILYDLKEEYGNKIVLIPIAVDSNIISLNTLISDFNIEEYPAIIIDDTHVISELSSVDEIKKYLK